MKLAGINLGSLPLSSVHCQPKSATAKSLNTGEERLDCAQVLPRRHLASISYVKFCELLQRCAQHFAGTGFLDEDNESHIAGVVRGHLCRNGCRGKIPSSGQRSIQLCSGGLLCRRCRLLTFVNNPFSSQNGGPSDPNSTLSAPTVLEYQLQLPFPQCTCVANDVRLIANSTYHGLQLLAEKRYSNGLQFLATYTWSKSIDDSSQADDNVTWPGSFSSL